MLTSPWARAGVAATATQASAATTDRFLKCINFLRSVEIAGTAKDALQVCVRTAFSMPLFCHGLAIASPGRGSKPAGGSGIAAADPSRMTR